MEFFSPGWAQKPMSCSDGDVWIFPLVPRPRHFPYRSHHLKGSYIYVLCSKNIAFPSSPAPSSPFSLFFSAPFPYWDFFLRDRKKKRGIHSNLLNGCLTPFIQPQKCGEIPNFRSRLGGNKSSEMTNQLPVAEIQGTSWVSARSSSCRIWRQTL